MLAPFFRECVLDQHINVRPHLAKYRTTLLESRHLFLVVRQRVPCQARKAHLRVDLSDQASRPRATTQECVHFRDFWDDRESLLRDPLACANTAGRCISTDRARLSEGGRLEHVSYRDPEYTTRARPTEHPARRPVALPLVRAVRQPNRYVNEDPIGFFGHSYKTLDRRHDLPLRLAYRPHDDYEPTGGASINAVRGEAIGSTNEGHNVAQWNAACEGWRLSTDQPKNGRRGAPEKRRFSPSEHSPQGRTRASEG